MNAEHIPMVQQHWEWLSSVQNGEPFPYTHTQFWAGTTVVLLTSLFLMHIWWYFLFLRILRKIVTSGSSHEAGRQEYEGDDEQTNVAGQM